MEPAGVPDVPRWLRGATVVLVAVMIVVGWSPRLGWGLMLDETFTAWQAQDGWAGIIPAKIPTGQSVLFSYLEAPFYFPHARHMELLLRVPALLGTAASCFFLYRLAETLVGKKTGALAVMTFISNLSVLVYSTQARPYALATAACLAALWGLARWLTTGSRRHGWTFAVALALIIHLHLLFAVFFLVPAFLIWGHARRGGRVDYRGLARWLGITAILLLPLVSRARDFLHHRSGLAPFRLPRVDNLLENLVPGSLLLAAVAFLITLPVARWAGPQALKDRAARPVLRLALVWLILPAVVFFALSYAVHQAVLIDRYFLYVVAAQGLIVALAFRDFPPILARLALLACFLPFPIFLGVHERAVPDGPGSWRRPIETVRALDPTATAPLFIQAGDPQSNRLDWQRGVAEHLFVYAPLDAYPLPNPVYPLPFALDEAAKAYIRRVGEGELAEAPLVFYAGIRSRPTTEWIREFFASRGYTETFPVDEDLLLLVLRKAHAGEPRPRLRGDHCGTDGIDGMYDSAAFRGAPIVSMRACPSSPPPRVLR